MTARAISRFRTQMSLLVLGCRLNIRQVGYEFAAFAHDAYRIVVDIDEAELAKPTIQPHLPVHADVGFFVEELARQLAAQGPTTHDDWLAWCRERRARYPVVLPEYRAAETPVNPYVFVDRLADRLEERDLVVCANGSACVVAIQAFAFKRDQRLLVNSGTAGMGFDLPASVGAAFARRATRDEGSSEAAVGPETRVICLVGDGSIQMNIQELQTIVQHELRSRSSSSTTRAMPRSARHRTTCLPVGALARVPAAASHSRIWSASPMPTASPLFESLNTATSIT